MPHEGSGRRVAQSTKARRHAGDNSSRGRDDVSSASGVQSIARAASILRALAGHMSSGARLSDVAAATGLHKATVHRILSALREQGLVDKTADGHRYHLGFELFVLGSTAANRFCIRDMARGSLTRIAEATGDTAYLLMRSGLDAICVAREEGSFPIRALSLDVGNRRPLGIGAGGLALAAFLPDSGLENVLAHNTPRYEAMGWSADDVRRRSETARERGYAVCEGEVVPGMTSLAVPVRDKAGLPLAAFSVAAIADRMACRASGGAGFAAAPGKRAGWKGTSIPTSVAAYVRAAAGPLRDCATARSPYPHPTTANGAENLATVTSSYHGTIA